MCRKFPLLQKRVLLNSAGLYIDHNACQRKTYFYPYCSGIFELWFSFLGDNSESVNNWNKESGDLKSIN